MKNKNKGFTLAEMLIVVAIIGVLIAIIATTLSNQLEKSREAVDLANIRNAMSEIMNAAIMEDKSGANGVEYVTYNGKHYYCKDVPIKQTKVGWETSTFKTRKNKTNTIYINDVAFACEQINIDRHGFRVKYVVESDKWEVLKPNKVLN